jgi:hypothetical protein
MTTGACPLKLCLNIKLISISEACIIFKPGKLRDGWFSASDLLDQVDNTIDIFEGITKGWAQGLFLFNNTPSHQKHADDTISAHQMPKCLFFFVMMCSTHVLSSVEEGLDRQTGWPMHV